MVLVETVAAELTITQPSEIGLTRNPSPSWPRMPSTETQPAR
ncbi:hypothetical protein [Nocardia wallacei]|nr:hypothetical protein [Nocardia wallacei]